MYLILDTKRLRIRPIKLTDAAFMTELMNTEGWLKFIGDRNITDIAAAEQYIQYILDNKNFYYHVFELKAARKPIGVITFLQRENEPFPDIGFALLPKFEKNGYTLEAGKAYLEKINALNTYKNIVAITISENKKSIGVLQKLGLRYEGNYKKGKDTLSYFSLKNNSGFNVD